MLSLPFVLLRTLSYKYFKTDPNLVKGFASTNFPVDNMFGKAVPCAQHEVPSGTPKLPTAQRSRLRGGTGGDAIFAYAAPAPTALAALLRRSPAPDLRSRT